MKCNRQETESGSEGLKVFRKGNWKSFIQVSRIEHGVLTRLHVCSRPSSDSKIFIDQSRSMYDNLTDELLSHGFYPDNIITEKIFLSDITNQIQTVKDIRREFYSRSRINNNILPAATFIQQPPVCKGQLCEIQVFAIASSDTAGISMHNITDLPFLISGKIIELNDLRHIYISNITGGSKDDGMDFFHQASSMFEMAEAALKKEGLTFHNVVRTWIYVNDINRHYTDLNKARKNFFVSREICPPYPASTGIQGTVSCKGDRKCSMDIYAAAGKKKLKIYPIHAPTMNEASAYGSYFPRGIRMDMEGRRIIYLSGTASVDTEGRVIHTGDIEGQIDRMLLNIEQLLGSQGATVDNLVSAITYLKLPKYLKPLQEICRQRGFSDNVPNTICAANICRPEWLCEMEAAAIL